VFTATDNTGGVCGTVNLKITVTTTGSGNIGLITLPIATVASLTFAASSIVADAGTYTV
jgi:hypothetical protein